ncbi:hypothetical protein [Halovenus halobia]|uniref:hypothetical protein n=1 Tax=Halovenus halobia TaxID=3396622 RepID=UPI003F54C6CB
MSEDDDGIEPYGRSRRPQRRDDDSPVSTDRDGHPPAAATSLADAVAQTASRPTTVDTGSLSATLVGVPRIDLQEFVYPHQLDPDREEGPRPVALFDIENCSDQRLRWRSARTKFIGSDEYAYQPARLSLEPDQLGPGCHTRQVELEPNSKARMVTLVEQLPQGVEVAKVVQTVPRAGAAQNERLVFAVE